MTMNVLDPSNKPASLHVDASGNLLMAGSGASPLPTGAATAAKQDTGNTSLASIDAKTPALSSGKVPVTDPTALPLPTGAATAAKQDTGNSALASIDAKMSVGVGGEYETVAASQTDQVMGTTGATGDYLEGVLCVVSTAATSQVQIKDGAGSAITILPNAVGAGVGSYYVPLGLISASGAWKITTAAGVSVIATGNFT